jgi:putative nucleotidyltransferase with HDIG domain
MSRQNGKAGAESPVHAGPGQGAGAEGGKSSFFAISPYLILPDATGRFTIFLKQGENLVLYTKKGEQFSKAHRDKLVDAGTEQVYVKADERGDYNYYVQRNLGRLLDDADIPLELRSKTWYQASVAVAKAVFEEKLPKPLNRKRLSRVEALIKASARFFTDPKALKQIGGLISSGFTVYHHSVGTMVLSALVLQADGRCDDELLVKCGLGAFLHDIGKVDLPLEVLELKPEDRTEAEEASYRSHPTMGVAMCANLPLPQEALNCILFHHERCNGKGYPTGMACEEIPFYVRALSVCNVYDTLTRTAVWRPAMSPYEALNHLRARKEAYDVDMLKKLIMILANAEIT